MEISKNIEDAINAIALVDKLGSQMDAHPIATVVLFFVLGGAAIVWFLVNYDLSRVFYPMEHKEKRRGEMLDAYVASVPSDDETKNNETNRTIADLREAHYFKVGTGIYAEGIRRSAYVQLHESMPHVVSWLLIRRALPHLGITKSGKTIVKPFSKGDWVAYRYNQFIILFMLLCAVALLAFVIWSGDKSMTTVLLLLGGWGVVVVTITVVLAQNWPMLAAMRIAEELAQQNNLVAQQQGNAQDKNNRV